LVSPHSSDLDLDAFDILDLPDFDAFNSNLDIPAIDSNDNSNATKVAPATTYTTNACESRAGIAKITDFSPDWAYQEVSASSLHAFIALFPLHWK
jgi:hypothetical protein